MKEGLRLTCGAGCPVGPCSVENWFGSVGQRKGGRTAVRQCWSVGHDGLKDAGLCEEGTRVRVAGAGAGVELQGGRELQTRGRVRAAGTGASASDCCRRGRA